MAKKRKQDGGRICRPSRPVDYRSTTPMSYAGEPKPRISEKIRVNVIAQLKRKNKKGKIARMAKSRDLRSPTSRSASKSMGLFEIFLAQVVHAKFLHERLLK